jgi:ATP-dependent Clp endopeptidase proteolytic subunit ClpP
MPQPVDEPMSIYKEPRFLETVENRIYFYSEVDIDRILQLNRTIREEGIELLVRSKNLGFEEVPKIFLHLFSYGGSIHAGFAGMDAILSSPIPVYTIIDGACASAGTFLSVVGKRRYIHKNAFILIHQLSSFMWGKYEEMKDDMANIEKFMSLITRVYKQYTKMPAEKIIEILKRDLWFDAEEALHYGLVDEVI